MRLEHVQGNDVKRPLVRGFQIHGARLARIDGQQPGSGTNAPGITGFQSGEIKSRCRRDEIVAHVTGEFKEIVVQDTAHGVGAVVVVIGVAATFTLGCMARGMDAASSTLVREAVSP